VCVCVCVFVCQCEYACAFPAMLRCVEYTLKECQVIPWKLGCCGDGDLGDGGDGGAVDGRKTEGSQA
jgi:hypothetical protein